MDDPSVTWSYDLVSKLLSDYVKNYLIDIVSTSCGNSTFHSSVYIAEQFIIFQQPTSVISQPESADCTALSEDYIWPSGFLCGWPDGLELTTDRVSSCVRCAFW